MDISTGQETKAQNIQVTIGWIVAALLLLAPFSWPYAYYQALRWVVAVFMLKTAYDEYQSKKSQVIILWVGIAVLYNPIVPFYLEKTTWNLCDVVISICIISHTITLKKSVYVH